MITLPIYGEDGQKTGEFDLDETVFGQKVRLRLMRQAVLMFEANQRQGTHSTKNRSKVSGANHKQWRQKGTGRARAGSRKNPVWRGGGPIFGPSPRDYRQDMNKKSRRAAFRSAMLTRLLSNQLTVIEDLEMPEPKTKRIQNILNQLNIKGSCLISVSDSNQNMIKSARNLEYVNILTAADLNCYQILRNKNFVVTKSALDSIVEIAKKR